MNFQKHTLKNGLRVVMAPMHSMESATVQVLIGAGTRDEEARVNGLAHFLEHMVFKGTAGYPTAQAISSAVDGIGGEINANTSKERTAYYIKALEGYLPLAFDILSQFIKEPLLQKEEIEKEKGVIIEEIAMYEDLPMQKVPYYFEELLWKGPLGWDVLGTKETVQNAKREDFLKFIRSSYTTQNMVVTVAGKFNQKEVLELAQSSFGDLKKKGPSSTRGRALQAKTPHNGSSQPELRLFNRKTEQAHLMLGVRGNPLGHFERYKEAVLASILGGGMSSRLWSEIREKRSLAYYVRSEIEHYRDEGYLATRAGVKLARVEEAIKVILEEYNKLKDGSISETELKKSKEYLKGRLALGLEDTHSVSEFFGDQELTEGKMRTVDEVMAGIEGVSAQDVQSLAQKFFQDKKLNLVIVGPYEDREKFKELLKRS